MVKEWSPERLKFLSLLGEQFPTTQDLMTEIINLNAIINLPKGTEHFMSDLHGEYEAFTHIINNASGVIREKVLLWLGDELSLQEVDELCTQIYYPREQLRLVREAKRNTTEWYRVTLSRFIRLAQKLSSKYTRSKVRKAMPQEYAYILDELLHAQEDEDRSQARYHSAIISTLIDIGAGDDFIIAVAALIKRLAVDRLHVVGDIFDRGPRADSIMDLLMQHHSVDIQWGNHDILWMGAAAGSEVCIAGVVYLCLRYHNTQILENGYGISLRSLFAHAEEIYPDLPQEKAADLLIALMMFKLEGQLIHRHPEYGMDDRLLLERIDREKHSISINGRTWPLREIPLDTVNPQAPYLLTPTEEKLMREIKDDFLHSIRLQKHIEFLYTRGRLYRCYNGNLLFHGCIPMTPDGDFETRYFDGQAYSGKTLMDYEDKIARKAFHARTPETLDFMWYLWCGDDSPLCGRKIKTFQRFMIEDPESWHEPRNSYYVHTSSPEVCMKILREFGLNGEQGRIINGHTPVLVSHGESPVKAGGRLVVIDGGFCKAYQKTTGIAGYTLISNSHVLRLMSHEPFTTLQEAAETGADIHSRSMAVADYDRRQKIQDTDKGIRLSERIEDLKDLLMACKAGVVRLGKNP